MRRQIWGAVAVMALVAGGCASGGAPERDPDVTGSIIAVTTDAEAVRVEFEPDAGGEYYEGTVFVLDAEVPVTGAASAATGLSAGDRIRVWTTACAESFPVQCDVEAVEVQPASDAPAAAGNTTEVDGRAPDAVGTLSDVWIAGGGGPVRIDEDSTVWGLASASAEWDGAELGIKRTPVDGVDNPGPTVFLDAAGNEIDDPSENLQAGQEVRVWCDAVAQSLPPLCSVSHLQLVD